MGTGARADGGRGGPAVGAGVVEAALLNDAALDGLERHGRLGGDGGGHGEGGEGEDSGHGELHDGGFVLVSGVRVRDGDLLASEVDCLRGRFLGVG